MERPRFARICGEEYNVVISRKPKQHKDYECYDFKVISKYNSKAIFNYLNPPVRNNAKKMELVDDARMHLSAIGWSFWSKVKKGHDEWRYDSPKGKTYYSLITACEAISVGKESNSCDSVCSDVVDDDKDDTVLVDSDENPRKYRNLGDDFCCNVDDDDDNLLADCEESPKSCDFSENDQDLGDSVYCNAIDYENGSKNSEFVGEDGDLRFRKCREKRTRSACAGNVVQEDEDELDDDEYCTVKLKSGLVSKKRKKKSTRVLQSSKRVRKLGAYSGSKNPRTVLSWLIENNAVVPRSKLYYMKRNSDVPLNEGRISSDGIKCNCCQKLFSLSGFQAHVTGNNICRPAENLFFGNGKSLVSCQVELMRKKIMRFDQVPAVRTPKTGSRFRSLSKLASENCNDYVCSICHYGGDLICCDRCPSSFHATCLNIESIPEGDWFCPCCCCGICGDTQFDKVAEQFADDSLLRCHQCERQFHAHCKKDRGVVSGEEHWFCCKTCEMMQWGLQQLVGKPIVVGRNLTCTLIKPMQYQTEDREDYDLAAMAENYSKLSVALEVMHECFDPVKDPKTKRDLVEDVVFCRGSNLNRLNFRGFYTVLLERNDELIAVALLRIYGDKVAEMPLIGTRFQHRRLGMCRILINEIEKTLQNLGVQKLVLPASPSVLNTWTTSFGFAPFTESDRLDFLGFTFLDFHDTVMCKKLLTKPPTPRIHRSSNTQIILHRPTQNIEGRRNNQEGNSISSMSGVSEEERQVSDNVDQRAQSNVTSELVDSEKSEGHKISLKLKFFKSKNGTMLLPLAPQTNYSKFEGSSRLVSPL